MSLWNAQTLAKYEFVGIQASVYISNNSELANMYRAVEALNALP